jgi:hypothetical protein
MWRMRWIAIGCATIALAMLLFNLFGNSSYEFWSEDFSFDLFVSAMALIFVLPAYLLYFGITVLVLRRTKLSIAARRCWLLGLPVLFLVGTVLNSANQLRPTATIQWVLQGKTVKSIHSVHSAFLGTMMSDRRIAWFEIAPDELRGLITQHQLTITNGVNIRSLVSGDRVLGQTDIADRIPSFRDAICYARIGSDDFQHPFSLFVLTNPNHDAAVWYSTYDR